MLSKETIQNMSDRLATKGSKFIVLHSIEEMTELQKALLKNVNRGKDNVDDIFDTLSDVKLHLDFLKMIYGFNDDDLDAHINKKTLEIMAGDGI